MRVHTFPSEVGLKGTIKARIPINSYPRTDRAVEYLLFFFTKSSKHPVLSLIEELMYQYLRESSSDTYFPLVAPFLLVAIDVPEISMNT